MKKPLLPVICLRSQLIGSLLIGTLFSGALLSMAAQAEIYKWKDANGVVRYSDIPPPANVQVESMQGKKKPAAPQAAEPAAEAKPDAVKAKPASESGQAGASKPEEITPEKVKEAEDILKKQNCQNAKANLKVLGEGPVYKTNEKGERQDLDEAAIAKEKEKAKKDVEKYCQ